MTRPRWMEPPTLEELDAEDQARREDEALDIEPTIAPWEMEEFPEWFPGPLKNVDRHIEGEQDWP